MNVTKVAKKLNNYYPKTRLGNPEDPLDDLIYLMLSSKTQPDRAMVAFQRLKKSSKGKWHWLLKRDIIKIAASLEGCGLERKKARWLKEIAKKTHEDFQEVSLETIRFWKEKEREKYLISLSGISKKTARCVMAYTFRDQVFAVDAHVFRVAKRLGWTESKSPESSADALQESVPSSLRVRLHVDFVQLGREFCKPRKPNCEDCPIEKMCPKLIK